MFQLHSFILRHSGRITAAATLLLYAAVAVHAQPAASTETAPVGRIDFSRANLPPATVELDLSQGMVADLFGIGDAATAGVAEALLKSAEANRGAEGARMAAEKLSAAREILQLAREVVREARVRIYENRSADTTGLVDVERLSAQFDGQLRDGKWETVARVQQKNESVRVAIARSNGAIRGLFVIVGNGRELVLANIVADVSPENVKKLSAAAATIGLENGLQQVIENEMRQLRQRQKPPAIRVEPKGLPTPAPAPAQK